ncbi:MAG: hypothetical protein HYZ38_14480 [Mycobacterium sp.]|nr:hypothetical protein [Mycobacterium sp.]
MTIEIPKQEILPSIAPAKRRISIDYAFAIVAVLSLIVTLRFGIPLLTSTSGDEDTQHLHYGAGIAWMVWGGGWTVAWVKAAIRRKGAGAAELKR